jgi:hypothetical protein
VFLGPRPEERGARANLPAQLYPRPWASCARTAVAGAVAHFQRAMMMDVDQAAKTMRDEEMQAEIEDYLEGFNQSTYRGMRINGQRVATWSSQHGWSGDSRPEAEWLQ